MIADHADQHVAGAVVDAVRVEHDSGELCVGSSRPRLSWTVSADLPDWLQGAYELELLDDAGARLQATGRIDDSESCLVPWPFKALVSRERVGVRVRVWDTRGNGTAWSNTAWVECGLLRAEDWTARFICAATAERRPYLEPRPLFRKEFNVGADVARARLYITAHGVYEARLNGQVIGDHVLAPGWTAYEHRLIYQAFDVSSLLRQGRNAIGAMVGDGWYCGRLGFDGQRNVYGRRPAFLTQLEITYHDGSRTVVGTNSGWRWSAGPVLTADLYDGESYDARLEQPGWASPCFDDAGWAAVTECSTDLAVLEAAMAPPMRRTQIIEPAATWRTPSGRLIVDFGQNLAGRLRITVSGRPGLTVTMRHAEVLADGELCVAPLRTAKATDRYTLRGDSDQEVYEPRFSCHGFRYAEIDGWPGDPRQANILAVVCHSDLRRTGSFECSDPLVNRLHENVIWSMRGNIGSVPTDCPQRDERLGWTGDIGVFAPSGSYLYDMSGFLASWLADLAAEQDERGVVPLVVPDVLGGPTVAAAAWGDAAVSVPWVLYERFGDVAILDRQFESMMRWVDHVASLAGPGRLWDNGFQFGDWLDPVAPADRPGDARTDKSLIATAYFARSAELLGRAAGVTGRPRERDRYLALAAEIRAAFEHEYATPSGRVVSDTPTAYTLMLRFGLLQDAARRERAGRRLAELVRRSGYHIATGFIGTPLICDALCDAGEVGAAYRLLMQRRCPSWLYPVTMGATTVWERWDSLLEDGSVSPGEMNSFNHYALGAIADWLHRVVGGLGPGAPGYRRLVIAPKPGGGLRHARTRLLTPYGPAESSWRAEECTVLMTAVVPPNTVAEVTPPLSDDTPVIVGSGTHRWRYQAGGPPGQPAESLESA